MGHNDITKSSFPGQNVTNVPSDCSSTHRCHVLVADDNEATRTVLDRMLHRFGYDVTRVPDGAAAVHAARATRFDLILMDGRMPVLDGYDAARQIREEEEEDGRRVPIILMSASHMPSDREAAREAGMDDVLPKPMGLQDLRATLERWCPLEPRGSGSGTGSAGRVDPRRE